MLFFHHFFFILCLFLIKIVMSLQNRFYYPFDTRKKKKQFEEAERKQRWKKRRKNNAERKWVRNIPISRLVIIKHQNKTIFSLKYNLILFYTWTKICQYVHQNVIRIIDIHGWFKWYKLNKMIIINANVPSKENGFWRVRYKIFQYSYCLQFTKISFSK